MGDSGVVRKKLKFIEVSEKAITLCWFNGWIRKIRSLYQYTISSDAVYICHAYLTCSKKGF